MGIRLGFEKEVVFTGGVANSIGVVKALEEELSNHKDRNLKILVSFEN